MFVNNSELYLHIVLRVRRKWKAANVIKEQLHLDDVDRPIGHALT